uniref:Uncharacterized protein n=1 Tax=Micromonas pusilla TaxID=38833 RepID=A0A7S0IFZ9_MICPS
MYPERNVYRKSDARYRSLLKLLGVNYHHLCPPTAKVRLCVIRIVNKSDHPTVVFINGTFARHKKWFHRKFTFSRDPLPFQRISERIDRRKSNFGESLHWTINTSFVGPYRA